jgi:hypothetical protein
LEDPLQSGESLAMELDDGESPTEAGEFLRMTMERWWKCSPHVLARESGVWLREFGRMVTGKVKPTPETWPKLEAATNRTLDERAIASGALACPPDIVRS